MTKPAVYQVSDWVGKSGDSWVSNQCRLDAMLAAFGDAAIAAADPRAGEQVLDIGCGAGASSFVLADRVGSKGRVLGLDISPQLIERARELGHGAVEFALADAAAADFAPQAYDLLFSRFGVMFFTDPAAAFAHMRGALKPGGRLVFVLPFTENQGETAMHNNDGPENPGEPHVSGTTPHKTVEKQPRKRLLRANCSTRLSHSRVCDTGLSSSNHEIIQSSLYS